MKRAGDENAADTPSGKLKQIVAIAHPAGSEDLSRTAAPSDLIEPDEIGPGPAPNPAQRHDNDARRPLIGLRQQAGRTQKLLPTKIERQDQPLSRHVATQELQDRRVANCFAAKNQRRGAAREPVPARRGIAKAAIDPELHTWKFALQRGDGRIAVAVPLDRIKIGDVDCIERIDIEKTANDVHWTAPVAQLRHDRAVIVAVAAARVHDFAGLEIDDRNDIHDGLTRVCV